MVGAAGELRAMRRLRAAGVSARALFAVCGVPNYATGCGRYEPRPQLNWSLRPWIYKEHMEPEIGSRDRYLPFAVELLNKLNWKPDPNRLIWHYTTAAGLMGIVESGSIFATQVSCLNDATEIRYAAKRLRNALTDLSPEIVKDEECSAFVRRFVELLQDDDAAPSSAALPYFVTCFTELEDDLSQWKSYSGGENGFAIGVRTGDLFVGDRVSLVARVNYDPQMHEQIARLAAIKTVEFYREGQQSGIYDWDEKFLGIWDETLTQVAPVLKDPGFAAENEVRLVHQLQEAELPKLKVLPRKTMMSRHLPIVLRTEEEKPRFPFAKVMVGPCRHREITRIGVDTLLRTHGYAGCPVVVSMRPYQET